MLWLHQNSFPLREPANKTEYNVGKKQMMKGKYEFQVGFFDLCFCIPLLLQKVPRAGNQWPSVFISV